MENSNKDYMENAPKKNANSYAFESFSRDAEDFSSCTSSFLFNTSDESFNSNSSSEYSTKKNDVSKNFDLSCDSDSKNSNQSYNEIDSRSQPKHHKSVGSIIKFLKSSVTNKSTKDQHQSILRRPTEYGYVRGISGLPIRVIKASSSTSTRCQHIAKR